MALCNSARKSPALCPEFPGSLLAHQELVLDKRYESQKERLLQFLKSSRVKVKWKEQHAEIMCF